MFLFSKNKISDKKDSSSRTKKDVIIYDYINRLEDKVKECTALYIEGHKLSNNSLRFMSRQTMLKIFL